MTTLDNGCVLGCTYNWMGCRIAIRRTEIHYEFDYYIKVVSPDGMVFAGLAKTFSAARADAEKKACEMTQGSNAHIFWCPETLSQSKAS